MLGFPKSRYKDLEAKLHDAFWDADDPRSELSLIGSMLETIEGPHLEVGSGSGRLLLPLLEQGFLVEGLESSSDMIQLCEKHALEKNLAPIQHHNTLEKFQTDTLYQSILIPAFTFQLLNDPKEALDQIKKILAPGGFLYLTLFIPWAELEQETPEGQWFIDKEIKLTSDTSALCKTRYWIDEEHQLVTRDHIYQLLDQKKNIFEKQALQQKIHYIWPNQLVDFLESEGFSIINSTSDFDKDKKVDEESSIMTFFAKKETLSNPAI